MFKNAPLQGPMFKENNYRFAGKRNTIPGLKVPGLHVIYRSSTHPSETQAVNSISQHVSQKRRE
jgi:hypothetical protein